MRQKSVKVVMCAVTAVLTFSSIDISVNAASNVASVLPSAGVDYTLASNGTSLRMRQIRENRKRRMRKRKARRTTA